MIFMIMIYGAMRKQICHLLIWNLAQCSNIASSPFGLHGLGAAFYYVNMFRLV